LESRDSEYGHVAGHREHSNKLSRSTNWWKFLDYLRIYSFLRKDSAPWVISYHYCKEDLRKVPVKIYLRYTTHW